MPVLSLTAAWLFLLAGAARAQTQEIPTFTAATPPSVSIGLEDGAEAYLLSGVSNALRLSDGRIVVAACGSSDLRWYDSTGRHLRTVGREGSGPGEFRSLRRIFPAGGDSIAAVDGLLGRGAGGSGLQYRVSLFAPDGELLRTISPPFRVDVLGRQADGSFTGRVLRTPPRVPGIHRRTITLYRLDGSGVVTDSVPGLPGPDAAIAENRSMRGLRLGPSSVVAVLPDRVVFGRQDEGTYTVYSSTLRVLRRVSTITRPEPVTAAVRRQWEETRDVLVPRGGVIGAFSEDYAPAMGAYRDAVAGVDGRLWLQDPYRPGVYPLVWTAYEDGRAVARAELPPRFFPTQFGANWVLGVGFDDLGVERVQLLTLRPGPLSGRNLPPRDAQHPDRPRCGVWTSR